MVYSSFYIQANIDRLDSDLLAQWIQIEKSERYCCTEMDLWLIDCYFQQSGKDSEAFAKYTDLTQGLDIPRKKVTQSCWDAIVDIHNPLIGARKVNLDDIETIEVLEIPLYAPKGLSDELEEKIIQTFLEHAQANSEKANELIAQDTINRIEIFETTELPVHMWNPESGDYKVLWEKTFEFEAENQD
jgi:hypothetical protein